MNQNKTKKIAVLLTAFNGEKYIKQQIESIKNQIGVVCTIFISIDKSSDKTEEICKNICNDRIKIIKNSGESFGSAGKNFYHLFREVNFEEFDFISLSDQDDIWKDNKLLRATQVLIEKNASAYSSDVECFWEDGRPNKVIKKSYPQKKFDYYFEPAGPGCSYVLTIKLAQSIKEKILKSQKLPFHHDWFIYAFARANNFNWFIDYQPNILYRQHSNNQVGANSGLTQYIKRLKKLKDGSYKNEVLEILEVLKQDKEEYKRIRKLILKNPFNYRRNKKEAIFLFLFCLLEWI